MDDRELRKVALHKATESCGGESTDYNYLLEAAEAIYQWLRNGSAEKPAQHGEPIWDWPVTREEPTKKRAVFADGLGVGTMDWPLVT
jgi:hypothetical protein